LWWGLGPGAAEPRPQADGDIEQLRQIDVVTSPRPAPRRQSTPGVQPVPAPDIGEALKTPLNTGTVAESASRLGLTPRQTPATVEVVDQQTLQDRGLRTNTEAAEAFVGVTAADPPGAPASFSMRGFSGSEINTLYNGIKVGPSTMTSRVMDTGNLEQIEILKGPASLLSGEGATGGAINYVTKRPHTGKVVNETFALYDSFDGYRVGFGSGGSTPVKGLDYRFDVTRSSYVSFIDDTYSKLLDISGQIDYRATNDFKLWVAAEHKEDKNRFYWGTPLVPANFPGIVPTPGVVSGMWTQYYPGPFDFAGPVGPRNPVTVDQRTLRTTYNVLDNDSGARDLWVRGGFDWDIVNGVKLKSQFYSYQAKRHWFNNEVNAFNDSPTPSGGLTGEVFRERLALDHDQNLYGNITDLILNSLFAGMENCFAAIFAASSNQFNVEQDTLFTSDSVALVNPMRGFYGPRLDEHIRTHVDNISLSFEDRLKITPAFALIGGLRVEEIELSRTRTTPAGMLRAGYPFSKTFSPVTGRVGYTWEAVPGLIFYSQYATAADPAVANIFILRPTDPLLLTTSRIYETGVKHLFWNNRAEWTLSVFDIERKNIYSTKAGQRTEVAGKVHSQGVELAGAVRPTDAWRLWGNVAFVEAQYEEFIDTSGTSFAGKTPPNVPRFVGNAGTSYRFDTRWPIEIGGSVRHVGDRFHHDDNFVTLNAYTLFDAFTFVDIDPRDIPWQGVNKARVTFRVRNLTDKIYAQWVDYSDQVILGSPRRYEVAAQFKF
jgi:iron complex outermembrane receptor protein